MGQGSGIREVALDWRLPAGTVVLRTATTPMSGTCSRRTHLDVNPGRGEIRRDPTRSPFPSTFRRGTAFATKSGWRTVPLVINRGERTRGDNPADDFVGLRIFDVSRPGSPRDICHWQWRWVEACTTTFDGVASVWHFHGARGLYRHHRHDPRPEADPARPEEVLLAGGWKGSGPRAAKHPAGRRRTTAATIRSGAAIACMSAYWRAGGGVILDIGAT